MFTFLNLLAVVEGPRGGSSRTSGTTSGGSGGSITNPVLGDLGNLTGQEFFAKFVPSAVGIGFMIGVVIFFFVLLIGAIQWISSGGEKQAVENAKAKITNAVIGLLVLFSLFAIIKLVETFFGFDILTLDIGPLKIQ